MSRLHVFGDEAGDLVFKSPGNGVSRYFMIGTIALEDCSVGESFLALRRELAWEGVLLDQLHATSDRQHVRDRAFDLIANTDLRFDVTILDKRKARDDLREDPLYFHRGREPGFADRHLPLRVLTRGLGPVPAGCRLLELGDPTKVRER